ncbi:hypothetical protein MYX75_07285 [Acidobacteria bacterium AH-259-A15]|nr:hypothetical protein [Acidobacteria bacterium AH-259-A15]
MKPKNLQVEDTLPIKLKIRVLEAELEQLESDLSRLGELREQTRKEICYYEDLLAKTQQQHHHTLRRIK